MKIKAGTILVLETGEYSDYSFTGPFKVLEGYDEAEIIDAHKKTWVKDPDDWNDEPSTSSFIAWMTKQGFIEPMEHVSWHIGSYGELEAEPHPEPDQP